MKIDEKDRVRPSQGPRNDRGADGPMHQIEKFPDSNPGEFEEQLTSTQVTQVTKKCQKMNKTQDSKSTPLFFLQPDTPPAPGIC